MIFIEFLGTNFLTKLTIRIGDFLGYFEKHIFVCLRPMADGPSDLLSCSCSGNFVNLLMGCTYGLNLAADLGPVLALFLVTTVFATF